MTIQHRLDILLIDLGDEKTKEWIRAAKNRVNYRARTNRLSIIAPEVLRTIESRPMGAETYRPYLTIRGYDVHSWLAIYWLRSVRTEKLYIRLLGSRSSKQERLGMISWQITHSGIPYVFSHYGESSAFSDRKNLTSDLLVLVTAVRADPLDTVARGALRDYYLDIGESRLAERESTAIDWIKALPAFGARKMGNSPMEFQSFFRLRQNRSYAI